jgi:hypothetical protein
VSNYSEKRIGRSLAIVQAIPAMPGTESESLPAVIELNPKFHPANNQPRPHANLAGERLVFVRASLKFGVADRRGPDSCVHT